MLIVVFVPAYVLRAVFFALGRRLRSPSIVLDIYCTYTINIRRPRWRWAPTMQRETGNRPITRSEQGPKQEEERQLYYFLRTSYNGTTLVALAVLVLLQHPLTPAVHRAPQPAISLNLAHLVVVVVVLFGFVFRSYTGSHAWPPHQLLPRMIQY